MNYIEVSNLVDQSTLLDFLRSSRDFQEGRGRVTGIKVTTGPVEENVMMTHHVTLTLTFGVSMEEIDGLTNS